MQYLISVIDDQSGSATPTEMAAIDVFNERLRGEGHWVYANGLASPSTATVIDNRGGKALLTDGPQGMAPAPTCCAGWAAVRSRGRRTIKPSNCRATPQRAPS